MSNPTLFDLEQEACSCARIKGMWSSAHVAECPALVVRAEWARQKVQAAIGGHQCTFVPYPWVNKIAETRRIYCQGCGDVRSTEDKR